MFKITNNKIELTRGDAISFNFSIKDYTFQVDDVVEFRVYSKRGLDKTPLLFKRYVIEEEMSKLEISLTSEETKLGELGNSPVTYWYEIEFNDAQTIIGYDEDGAKELVLYPEGEE